MLLFNFQGDLYKQTKCRSLGILIWPMLVNAFVEKTEQVALNAHRVVLKKIASKFTADKQF